MEARRAVIYESLETSIERNGGILDEESVCQAVQQFDEFMKPKAYPVMEGQDIRLLCCPHAPVSQRLLEATRVCFEAATEIASVVHAPNSIHLNTEASMHVTLFHTSHPDDRRAFSPEIRAQELDVLRRIAASVPGFTLKVHSIVIASSGSIVMLFEDPEDGIERIRNQARSAFPSMPKKQPAIIHSTLARMLSPSMTREDLAAIQDKCHELTTRLKGYQAPISSMWYVEETHFFSAQSGRHTTIELSSSTIH
ncbi:hypothetical protein LEN26_001383 [Aphanomyces euteiches]|nr:hypothetical protein AeMF1_002137 [Aphanomyces euteiches]KAH9161486.1 hypothetical protein LEN26_001383 [Aphanomyces euteiches]